MTTLTIRDLDDDVKARLRVRAAEHGRSMEAEARAILAASVRRTQPGPGLGSRIHQRFAEVGGADLDLPERDEPPRAADPPRRLLSNGASRASPRW